LQWFQAAHKRQEAYRGAAHHIRQHWQKRCMVTMGMSEKHCIDVQHLLHAQVTCSGTDAHGNVVIQHQAR